MQRITLCLIRHGDTLNPTGQGGITLSYGPKDDLSSTGRKQVAKLTNNLPLLDGLYSSPFPRAFTTAEIIQKKKKIPFIYPVEELQEIKAPGWENLPLPILRRCREEIQARGKNIYDPEITPPKDADLLRETIPQVLQRTTGAVNLIISKELAETENKTKTIGIISHAVPIVTWIYSVENPLKPLPTWEQFHIDEKLNGDFFLKHAECWKISLVVDTVGKIQIESRIRITPEGQVFSKEWEQRGNEGKPKRRNL